MGCKGSKHKSAAAQDAIAPQKKSELPSNNTATEVQEADVKPAGNDASAVVEPVDESVKEVKDITVNVEGEKEEEVEAAEPAPVVEEVEPGKNIVSGSPDRYFSSRKDDDGTESSNGGEGLEYYSPSNDPEQGRSLIDDIARDEVPVTEEIVPENNEDIGNGEEETASIAVDADDTIVQPVNGEENEEAAVTESPAADAGTTDITELPEADEGTIDATELPVEEEEKKPVEEEEKKDAEESKDG